MPKKSDYWLITSIERVVSKVSFEDEVTKEEAIEAFENGDYYDITDESRLEIIKVESADPIGDDTEDNEINEDDEINVEDDD